MKKSQAEYEQNIPIIEEKVEKLRIACANLEEEISKKTDEIKDFETNLLKLEIKEAEASEGVVTEEDYKKRLDAVSRLKLEIEELRQMIDVERTEYNNSSAELNNLSKIFEEIKKILEKHELSHYESLM